MSASSIRRFTMTKYEIRINKAFLKIQGDFKETGSLKIQGVFKEMKKIPGGFQEVKQIPGDFQEISQKNEIPGVFQELLEFQEAARTLLE